MTGRVTDTDGDPLWGIQVQALKVYGSRGQRHISTVGSSATDDQGSFRIPNLSPGSYYVVADNLQSRTQYETVRPGRAPNRLTNVATYYPNAVDAASAVALDIAPGSELHGIEIQMRSEAAFSIRGVAIYAATGKPVIAALNVRLKNNEGSGLGSGATHSRGDGTFELRNLLPGVYVISASSNNTAEPGKAREEVTITDSDITGVKLALAQGAAMAGIIKLEGAGPLPVHPMIVLTGVDGTEGFSNTQPKDDGTFELHGIAPAKYAAMVYGLPDGVYVKSVRVGGQDVTHSTIDFTSGVSGTLDILLSPRAAEVLGTVRNKDGGALPGGQVTLWPRKLRPENVWSGPAQSATDQNGDFRIAGLAPGEYYAIAWEEIELGLTYELDFLKRFESQATTVTLEEGSHQTAQPKLISREAAAAEAAKLN
jgi:hypothetical protein